MDAHEDLGGGWDARAARGNDREVVSALITTRLAEVMNGRTRSSIDPQR